MSNKYNSWGRKIDSIAVHTVTKVAMDTPVDLVGYRSHAAIAERRVPAVGMGRPEAGNGIGGVGLSIRDGSQFQDLTSVVAAGFAVIVIVESGAPGFIVA